MACAYSPAPPPLLPFMPLLRARTPSPYLPTTVYVYPCPPFIPVSLFPFLYGHAVIPRKKKLRAALPQCNFSMVVNSIIFNFIEYSLLSTGFQGHRAKISKLVFAPVCLSGSGDRAPFYIRLQFGKIIRYTFFRG